MSEIIYIGTHTISLDSAATNYTFGTAITEGYTANGAEWIQGISITNNTDEFYGITLRTGDQTKTFCSNTRLLPRSTLQIFTTNDKLQLQGNDLRFNLQSATGQYPNQNSNTDEVVAAITYKFSRNT
jgi:hypothetical protein